MEIDIFYGTTTAIRAIKSVYLEDAFINVEMFTRTGIGVLIHIRHGEKVSYEQSQSVFYFRIAGYDGGTSISNIRIYHQSNKKNFQINVRKVETEYKELSIKSINFEEIINEKNKSSRMEKFSCSMI
jgi:hypothetical protein